MESLKTNTFSKHFLLGNNITGPVGARAIAEYMHEFPDKFETWYLAGNCIDGASFSALVDAMVQSPAITNAWLKRNPLGSGAAKDVFRLVTETPNLRTLDLDQTELGDEGVAELFALLADHAGAEALPLRNIYFNGTGIGMKACKQVKDQSLQRLSLQSCGLKDAELQALMSSLNAYKGPTVLDLGQGSSISNISYSALTQTGLNALLAAVGASPSLLWFHAKASSVGAKDVAAVKAGQEDARLYQLARERLRENVQRAFGVDYARFEAEEKRFLVSPRDVRFIDSVYRNRDAGAARRGLKRLEKWWTDGDETLTKVAEGSPG